MFNMHIRTMIKLTLWFALNINMEIVVEYAV